MSQTLFKLPPTVVVALLIVIHGSAYAVAPPGIGSAIAERLHGRTQPTLPALEDALTESDILLRIYDRGDFVPLWSSEAKVERFLELLADAPDDGLLAADYRLPLLEKLKSRADLSVGAAAEFDMLLTDAFARFAYHLRFGKADPHGIDPNWNYSRRLVTTEPAEWLREAIATDRVTESLDWLRPKIPTYGALKAELRRYRAIAAAGGWPVLPDGPSLKPGADDSRVPILRVRLEIYTGAALPSNPGTVYDPTLEGAVRGYQRRHGLTEDGIVGKATRAALNSSVTARIGQLRVNLERIRWLFRDIEENFIAVNIAAFQAAYIKHGNIVWRSRAVVGRPFRQTPSFKATLKYMIFNPTWTVPPTILKNDVLPAMRKDGSYLAHKGLRVLSPRGVPVDPATIDWQHASAARFPYVLRQGPGPHNALGRVKFMFPNPHLVYLHDTPAKDLFKRAERGFSSGCIRLERPLELAQILLDENDPAAPLAVSDFLADEVTRRVDLRHPVTVMLLYLTAFAADDGAVQFRGDIYRRDQAVLDALDGPFKFVPPRGYPVNPIESVPDSARKP